MLAARRLEPANPLMQLDMRSLGGCACVKGEGGEWEGGLCAWAQ